MQAGIAAAAAAAAAAMSSRTKRRLGPIRLSATQKRHGLREHRPDEQDLSLVLKRYGNDGQVCGPVFS